MNKQIFYALLSNCLRVKLHSFSGIIVIGILAMTISLCRADDGDENTAKSSDDLSAMSIQDLMGIEITSVSKKEEKLSDAPAAIFVITQEDIRRSGVTSIPEALRMVPGLEVARIDSNKWAITSRGLNGRFANKLLVLIDGRSIYSPLFSGVFWDRQDTLLEDIDRIEVIRGPGATLWGANAVNGVINIITKNADETVGGLVTAGGGNEERGFGGVRYGNKLGEDTSFRLFAKYLDRAPFVDATGKEAADSWHTVRGGFRLDSEPSDKNTLTVQGDIYDGRLGETYTTPILAPPYSQTFDSRSSNFGADILSRWKHTFSDSSDMSLQLYYDRAEQTTAILGEKLDTIDIDFQHRFELGSRQEVVWGAGYRFINDSLADTPTISMQPSHIGQDLFSAFLQDSIEIVTGKLHLIIGSKFEHNDMTGFEVQPNARLLFTPNQKHTIWAAVSRAVRTPSLTENDVSLNLVTVPPATPLNPGPIPILVQAVGSKTLKAEEVIAYEIGYRVEPDPRVSLDIAAFYNIYHHGTNIPFTGAATFEPSPLPHITQTLVVDNAESATTYGAELAANWAVLDWWRLYAAYTFLEVTEQAHDGTPLEPDPTPRHQVSLRSQTELTKNVEFDLWLRYVDSLPGINIGGYVTFDTRLSWRPVKNLELSLVGQNLAHDHLLEFIPEIINTLPTATERSFYGKATWTF
jgi:iron complex outermembrane recepter protein